jgi:hypothetical protein
MPYSDRAKGRHPPAARFFLFMDLASALFVLWAFLRMSSIMDATPRDLIWLSWTLLLFAMLFRRGQDEFWDLCWRRASAATFAGLLIVPPLILFTLPRAGQPAFFDHDVLVIILFAIFFARFQWTRFRGAMN